MAVSATSVSQCTTDALRVIISPAKRMQHGGDDTFAPQGRPFFLPAARSLATRLCAMSFAELKDLWKCSDALARDAADDLEALDPTCERSPLAPDAPAAQLTPAVMAYIGIQYQSMAPQVMSEAGLAWIQEHLRILSGLYGALRPFDGVAPYRLEMQARLAMPCRVTSEGELIDEPARDLYDFWGASLAKYIESDGSQNPQQTLCLVNLASVEYADAVLPHLDPATALTTCIFLEPRDSGTPVQRATASKIARGAMVRWMAEEGIDAVDDLRAFEVGGYRFDAERSREGLFAFVHSS